MHYMHMHAIQVAGDGSLRIGDTFIRSWEGNLYIVPYQHKWACKIDAFTHIDGNIQEYSYIKFESTKADTNWMKVQKLSDMGTFNFS